MKKYIKPETFTETYETLHMLAASPGVHDDEGSGVQLSNDMKWGLWNEEN